MRQISQFAGVSAMALVLAACGGPAEEDTTEVEIEEEAPVEEVASEDGEAGEEGEAGEGEEAASGEEAEEPAPAATASATPTPTPTPTPTQVAAMEPPASFTQCTVCHSVEPGQMGIGPSLAGVHGRKAGAVSGFAYTAGMRDLGVNWNDANLNRYLTNPQEMVPGTTMAIGPLNAQQRAAIIAYLKTL